MKLFVAGISYKTAPVEIREKLAVGAAKARCAGCRVQIGGGLYETVILSTCNRVEIYGVADKVNGNIAPLFEHLAARPVEIERHMYVREGAEAVRHLLSVVSGLDSMVLGETEITGQVKQAYQSAQEARLTGKVLNRLFQKSLQTSKEIRTRTMIGRGSTSVGSVAVDLAEKVFGGDLTRKTVMIIGAGAMGQACVRQFAKRGVKGVIVANRSIERAQTLAGEFEGRAIGFEDRRNALREADILVSSTGAPELILEREDLEAAMRARRQRPLVLIDIAVPRDIDPAVQFVPNVYLYNVDDLEAVVRENVRRREQELTRCREIIESATRAIIPRLLPEGERRTTPGVPSRADWAPYGAVPCWG